MSYPYDAATLAAITRLGSYYNGNNYNAGSNPGGMGAGGHRINFILSLQDFALSASSAADAANAASTYATNASNSAAASALSASGLSGTSTTSVTIGTGSKGFFTQSGKSFDVGTFVHVSSDASPTTHYMIGQVTAYSGTALTVNVQHVGSGTGARTDWTIFGRVGEPGDTGPVGATGPSGVTPLLKWTFIAATTDSDPGNGQFNFNNATYSSVTFIYFDNNDVNSTGVTSWLDALDDSTNTAMRGVLNLQQVDTPANYAIFDVTGAVIDGTGYRKVPVAYVLANNTFTPGHQVQVTWSRTGDKGADGAGAGDVISDIASVTDSFLVKFNGTTGKHVTHAGAAIGTSGTAVPLLSTANTWGGAQTFAGLTGSADFYLSGDITPTQITATADDYNPTGLATATVLRLSTDASRNLNSLAGGADGRVILLQNVGSNDLVIKHETGTTPAYRFDLGADWTLHPLQCLLVMYDALVSRWRPLSYIGVGAQTITATSATALAVGRQGTTAPALQVDTSVASSATGLKVTSAAAAGGVALAAISSGTDEGFNIDAKGAGAINIGANSTGVIGVRKLAEANPHCGKLTINNTTSLRFAPYKGDRIKINGVIYAIPAGGIAGLANTNVFVDGIPGQSLIAFTQYLVAVFNNGGVLTADYRTTLTHTQDTTSGNVGVEIPTGVPSRTVIGLIKTIGAVTGTFVDSYTMRFVRSWFNPGALPCRSLGVSPATWTSSTPGEVDYFECVVWSDDVVHAAVSGMMSTDVSGWPAYIGSTGDGATYESPELTGWGLGYYVAACPRQIFNGWTTGYHWFGVSLASQGGGATVYFWGQVWGEIAPGH